MWSSFFVGSSTSVSNSQPQPPPVEDLQDLNNLARRRCWGAIERSASTTESIHHESLTPTGNSALHTAISNGAPLSTVRALVTANPTGVALKNNFGNTPLHFAAWKNKYPDSVAIVGFLLDFHPQAARTTNKNGHLPLHHAANYKAPAEICKRLLEAYPDACSARNDKGKTPADLALHRLGSKQHPVVVMLQEISD